MLLSDFFPRSPATPTPGEDVELDRIVGLVELSGTPVTPQLREIIHLTTMYDNLAGQYYFNKLDAQEAKQAPTRTAVFDQYESQGRLGLISVDMTDIACHALLRAYRQPSRTSGTFVTLNHEPIHRHDGDEVGFELLATITRDDGARRVSLPLKTAHDNPRDDLHEPTYVDFLGYAETVFGSVLDLLVTAVEFMPDLVESLASDEPMPALATH